MLGVGRSSIKDLLAVAIPDVLDGIFHAQQHVDSRHPFAKAVTASEANNHDRELFYYRQRSKNRLFEALTSFFAEEAERRGITKRDLAESLKRDPAQITRWFTARTTAPPSL